MDGDDKRLENYLRIKNYERLLPLNTLKIIINGCLWNFVQLSADADGLNETQNEITIINKF